MRSPAGDGERSEVRGQIAEVKTKFSMRDFHFCNLTSHLASYMISSLLIRAIGCCITSSSFFTRFSP